jgi:hypothetical protein
MSEETKQGETPFVVAPAPKSVELTAYQGGQAVVRERRTVSLKAGKSRLAFEGLPTQFVEGSLTVVASKVMASSSSARSATNPPISRCNRFSPRWSAGT